MTILEQEVIDKFHKLDPDARKRVLDALELSVNRSETPLAAALKAATDFRLRIAKEHPAYFGIQDMLDEIREEASWPRQS
jgi:hypothetical protein